MRRSLFVVGCAARRDVVQCSESWSGSLVPAELGDWQEGAGYQGRGG